ncbi:MAG: PilN domain-containing protein [Sedimentisphaerales bacterium]|nr:PilN domain-containing protein [Sedimentisphaerales bacterium]
MKEIDFLPEWYKSGIRRQVNYRVQYIILSGVFVVMMVWNFVSAGSVSRVRAKCTQMKEIQIQSERASTELEKYKSDIAILHEREKILGSIDSKINVSNVLAELSFLIDEKIVLSKVELISEIINDKQNNGNIPQSMSAVRSSVSGDNSGALLGNVCFRVLIKGVAANGSDVAVLLCNLEDSPYFSHVNLLYSKDSEVKNTIKIQPVNFEESINNQNKTNNGNINVSEFEIKCCLSNYIESQ